VIPAAELSALRTVIERSYVSDVTILRRTETRDAQGGTRVTFVSAGTYKCIYAKSPIRPQEREETPFVQGRSAWTFLFKTSVVVLPTDRLLADGRTFEVVDGSIGSEDLGRRVIASEIV